MRSQTPNGQFKRALTNPLLLAVIILFSCSHTILAQQKDGEANNSESHSAPSRPAVNLNYLFSNITLANGDKLEILGPGSNQGIIQWNATSNGAELGTTSASPLLFSTNGAERMRISLDGFVGIGTNNPLATLDIFTPASMVYSPTATQPARFRFINSNSTLNNAAEIDLGAYDSAGNAQTRVRLVAISTNNTPAGTSGDFVIGLRKNGALFESARFASSGRVGFGTNDPKDAFHLFSTDQNVGTMRVQGGNTYAGFVGNWEGSAMLLLTNNRHPGTGHNYNTAIPGSQITLGLPSLPGDIGFYTTTSGTVGASVELMRIRSDGRVGIGIGLPNYKLDVQGGQVNASGGLCINGDCKSAWSQIGSQWTTSGSNLQYTNGNVGIGVSNPTFRLHVGGDVKVTGSMTVDGNIAAKYQDLAEWVPAAEQLAAGTVVVLDSSKSNQVTSSSQSYDTRVAGVISAQPGIVLGEKSDSKVLVATTGRVLVNVDATNGPIEIGDLLVTSDREGFAMKSVPVEAGAARIHRPGTLIGKALEPLRSGTGKILVLLSLQ